MNPLQAQTVMIGEGSGAKSGSMPEASTTCSHQPDLNFDNPLVREAVKGTRVDLPLTGIALPIVGFEDAGTVSVQCFCDRHGGLSP